MERAKELLELGADPNAFIREGGECHGSWDSFFLGGFQFHIFHIRVFRCFRFREGGECHGWEEMKM